ncbi:TPA: rhodanese-like domain-containing protein [Streptococcus suis]|nr:rhodanese-like domain-containing protein [Streptococcus suis]
METVWTLLAFVVILGGWMGFNYWRLRQAATVIDNGEFAEKIQGGQLIDLREPGEFRKKHILGARNIPYQQLRQSTAALRKDKPILIYENDRGQLVTPAALHLKKQGFSNIFILRYGLNGWNGKTKVAK